MKKLLIRGGEMAFCRCHWVAAQWFFYCFILRSFIDTCQYGLVCGITSGMSKVSEKIEANRKNRQIRFSDEEWALLEMVSGKVGLNGSSFIRSSALERALLIVGNAEKV
ncbi:MAG: hypothetical protein RLZZ156_2673 [Deinococcota bacterium]|jgi:hypothetical protein